jgi:hypothetical protein
MTTSHTGMSLPVGLDSTPSSSRFQIASNLNETRSRVRSDLHWYEMIADDRVGRWQLAGEISLPDPGDKSAESTAYARSPGDESFASQSDGGGFRKMLRHWTCAMWMHQASRPSSSIT